MHSVENRCVYRTEDLDLDNTPQGNSQMPHKILPKLPFCYNLRFFLNIIGRYI